MSDLISEILNAAGHGASRHLDTIKSIERTMDGFREMYKEMRLYPRHSDVEQELRRQAKALRKAVGEKITILAKIIEQGVQPEARAIASRQQILDRADWLDRTAATLIVPPGGGRSEIGQELAIYAAAAIACISMKHTHTGNRDAIVKKFGMKKFLALAELLHMAITGKPVKGQKATARSSPLLVAFRNWRAGRIGASQQFILAGTKVKERSKK